MEIIDEYGRTFKTLRVSLTNTCNLGCLYCVESEDDVKESNVLQRKNKGLANSELLEIIGKLHEKLSFSTVRLTGGEPTLYHELIPMVEGLKNLGIAKISMTTNGVLLERMVSGLKNAGLDSINVSLDAVDPETFFKLSRRRNLDAIIKGIDKALESGLKVKINAVIIKGINENQILPLLDFAFQRNITIRFLEMMKMGYLHQSEEYGLFTEKEILFQVSKKYNFQKIIRGQSSTANYWETPEKYCFGIIANESSPFCHDCNRLRINSHGEIFGCLSSNHAISLKSGDSDFETDEKLLNALSQKQMLKFTGSDLSMLAIGG